MDAAREPLYCGDNVHSYTAHIRGVLPLWLPRILAEGGVDEGDMEGLLTEMRNRYGMLPALSNVRCLYGRDPAIGDPDLPGLNCAALLRALWRAVKRHDDPSLYAHFGETLEHIGATCLQGVSHRLFCDYLAVCDAPRAG